MCLERRRGSNPLPGSISKSPVRLRLSAPFAIREYNMIQIVNIKTYKGSDGWSIHRPSPLGNPFKIDSKTSRAMVIQQYREWLKGKLLTDNPTSKAFRILLEDYQKNGKLTLQCFCSPLQCHGEVIREFILEVSQGIPKRV